MTELIILAAMVLAIAGAHIWPHIRHEERLTMPDSWEPEHRGRVNQLAGGCYWVVGRGRKAWTQ